MRYGYILVLLLIIPLSYSVLNSTFVPLNASENFTRFEYDRINTTTNSSVLFFGSDSYADDNPTNPDVSLRICNDTLIIGSRIDIRYTDENLTNTGSLLYANPKITSVQNYSTNLTSYSCADIDMSLATTKSLYPGLLSIYVDDVLFDHEIGINFNGSYQIGVRAFSFPRRYDFIFNRIYDHNQTRITSNDDYLFMSLVNASNYTKSLTQTRRTGKLSYSGSLQSGDTVYVNGLKALEIIPVSPCANITSPGYYLLNDSEFNRNVTCFTLDNLDNTVLNFGDDLIDGDNETNGSQTLNRCPIIVRNSQNITLENLKTQQFYYGVCVINSTVNILGSNLATNSRGALVTNGSYVELYNLSFANSDFEIDAYNGSTVNLTDVQIPSAYLSTIFHDATIRTVSIQPPDPVNLSETIQELNQSVEIIRNDVDTWAFVRFKYVLPLANNRGLENMSMWKYNGSLVNESSFDNTTNITTYSTNWTNGTWLQLSTAIDTQNQWIFTPNMTNFSIFKLFAGESNNTEPDPFPEPVPTTSSNPQAGSSSGGGGTPSGAIEGDIPVSSIPVELELNLSDNITFMQGAIGFVEFTLENIGNITARDILVNAQVPAQWQSSNVSVSSIPIGDVWEDSFILGAFEKASPGTYQIPVSVYARNGSNLITQKILNVIIVPRGNVKRLRVLEYPPVITMSPFTQQDVSMLIRNVGDIDLTGVTIQIDDTPCLENVAGENNINSGDTELITYKFFSGSLGNCAVDVKFYDSDGDLVGFVPLTLDVVPELSAEAQVTRNWLLVLLFVWTLITVFVVGRRKRKMTKIVEDDGQIEL